jgi:uncharacterized protein YkwD
MFLMSYLKLTLISFVLVAMLNAQYIPYPSATALQYPSLVLNPSINDPLFYTNLLNAGFVFPGHGHHQHGPVNVSDDVVYTPSNGRYTNSSTGDYYDPKTGAIYRKKAAAPTVSNGYSSPNPPGSSRLPWKSDPVYLANDYANYETTSKPSYGCNGCYYPKAYWGCSTCYMEKNDTNIQKDMAAKLMVKINDYRVSLGLNAVRFVSTLTKNAVIQNKYMMNVGYLNHDHFKANLATYSYGNETSAYINGSNVTASAGADDFMGIFKYTPEHRDNLLNSSITQCGVGIYKDATGGKYWGTVLCGN